MTGWVIGRRQILAGAGAALAAPAIGQGPALGQSQSDAIRIGEINSYTAQPAFLLPYRNGWSLAVEQVNAAGGINGRRLETLHRDDAGKPEDAVRLAGELANSEKVALLSGGFLSNVGLAIADYANQNRMLYVASEPLTDALVWARGNRYTFRLRPAPTCSPRCWSRKRRSCRPSVGRPSRRTTNTASPRCGGSRNC